MTDNRFHTLDAINAAKVIRCRLCKRYVKSDGSVPAEAHHDWCRATRADLELDPPVSTEHQGAVCGTCGQPPCQCGDARLGAHHTEAWYADHDFTLPAPVVPSDERRQCWEVFSTTAIGASVIEWHCKLEKGHDGDHMDAQIHAAAPPTPSQDAEGDGRMSLLDAIRRHARFAADFEVMAQNIDRPIADTPWLAEHRYGDGEYDARWYAVMGAKDHFTEGLQGAIEPALAEFESAIRAPYEELVKALLTSSIAQSVLTNFKSRGVSGVCDVLERDWGSDESDVAEFCAALTNIEESLGGRS